MARRWEHKGYVYLLDIKISSDTIRLWNHNNEEHSGVDISKIGKAIERWEYEYSSPVEATG